MSNANRLCAKIVSSRFWHHAGSLAIVGRYILFIMSILSNTYIQIISGLSTAHMSVGAHKLEAIYVCICTFREFGSLRV
jgi:hypothetical protein